MYRFLENSIVLMPLGLPWSWHCDYERQTAIILSKKTIVIVIDPTQGKTLRNVFQTKAELLKQEGRTLFVYKPLYIIPFQRIMLVKKVNFYFAVWILRFIIAIHPIWRKKTQVFWTYSLQNSFFPSYFGKKLISVYDCFDAFGEDDVTIRNWVKEDTKLRKESDIVFVSSHTLKNYYKLYHTAVYKVTLGFNKKLFEQSISKKIPDDIKHIKSPIIGYAGSINTKLDIMDIVEIVKKCKKYSFVFVGSVNGGTNKERRQIFEKEITILNKMPNVFFLGNKQKSEIPSYINFFDVGIIPYNIHIKFNQFCFPMKLFEFFYLGKPVISTPISEMEYYKPYVKTYKTPIQASQALDEILSSRWSVKNKKQQKQIAIANDWDTKINEKLEILEYKFKYK